MRSSQEQFDALMKRLREESEDAAFELFDLCKNRVYAAVRRRLNRRMRSLFDSHDFVQAMWASFFSNLSVISRFDNEEELVGFLIRVAGNKVTDEFRKRFNTEKHSIQRERHLGDENSSTPFALADAGPSPSENAIANELWSQMLEGITPRYRQILELRRAGATMNEIAIQLDLSERTVRRIIKNLVLAEME